MTRKEAFEKCLDLIKKKSPKGTWASLVYRFKADKLKEQTIKKLLTENGFTQIQEEEWILPLEDMPETNDGYVTLAMFDKNSIQFSIKTIKADSVFEAKRKNGGFGEDVTGGLHELCRFVNDTIKENYI